MMFYVIQDSELKQLMAGKLKLEDVMDEAHVSISTWSGQDVQYLLPDVTKNELDTIWDIIADDSGNMNGAVEAAVQEIKQRRVLHNKLRGVDR